MKEFRVTQYDYDRDIHRTVIVDTFDFDNKKEALNFAKTLPLGSDTVIKVTGNYGYDLLLKIERE